MKCLRCGQCCTTKGIMQQSSWLEKIAYRIALIKHAGWQGLKNPACPNLRKRSRNYYCAIYENRPPWCKEYYCEKAKKQ